MPSIIRELGPLPYAEVFAHMQSFTAARTDDTPDEIWLCEHPPVLTQGRHGLASHILDAHDIPVVATDRGGQVTYHGPGQLMIYVLMDLKRRNIGVYAFVSSLEALMTKVLQQFNIPAHGRDNMPGVYVDHEKICSIGLRVKNGKTYHGLALNMDMDLTPFSYIHPCGYEHLTMTQVSNYLNAEEMLAMRAQLVAELTAL